MSKSYSMKETDIGEERRNLRDPTVYTLHPWTMYKVELYSQPRIGSPILYTGKLKIKN
jgi:hypothetical protein